MEFNPTSLNVTEVLVIALAVTAAIFVMRKRYDSNLPLLFYFVLVLFNNMSERGVNPYLLYTGLIMALLLRFEFMGGIIAKAVAFLTAASLCVIIWLMMAEVLT
ncbi:MAG TPA: hypothetical protein VGG72_26350 [Bryobacteraceae bacterium]|jgi:hypothetical protein